MRINLLLIALFISCIVQAQDTYHTTLLNFLQEDYGIQNGEWILYNSEDAIIANAFHYGATVTNSEIDGQTFSQKVRLEVAQAANAQWDVGWILGNNIAIQQGDAVLAVFYLRSQEGPGKLNFFIENAVNYDKEVFFTLPVDEEWRRYLIPIRANNNYGINGLNFGFHLGHQAQIIEMGGFTALNFNNTPIDNLPNEINNEFYIGYELDAPWRAVAAERIDQLRKAELSIEATTSNGTPVADIGIEVKMLQHDFAFGTAITASRIAGNNAQNFIYENKLINLDGAGHGFNYVVFENDLKWDAWEEEWFVNKTELVNAINWLRNQGIKIRGHALVWPGNSYLPNDIPANLNNPTYVKNRIDEHLEEVLTFPGIEGQIEEWDVLNEVVVNNDIANAFSGTPGYATGRELYAEIFEKTRALDSNTGLWLNDYVTMTLNQEAGSLQYEQLKQYTQELIDAGVDIEGIGFQAHIGGFPNGIPSVLGTLDDFYDSFGLKAKITEFDMPSYVTEELGADYLRDFMTAVFSHPSVDGFLFWNFWDGATWLNAGTNLYRLDWTATPSKDAFVDLVFNEWWTEELFTTEMDGIASSRVFKGLYEISYICDGILQRDTIEVGADRVFQISCDNLSTDTEELLEKSFRVFPNPSSGRLHIINEQIDQAAIRVIDSSGKLVYQDMLVQANTILDLSHLKGFYFLEIRTTTEVIRTKLVFQ